MDKFLSGFGFGSISSGSNSKPPENSAQSLTSTVASPKKDPAKVMGQAPKVSNSFLFCFTAVPRCLVVLSKALSP